MPTNVATANLKPAMWSGLGAGRLIRDFRVGREPVASVWCGVEEKEEKKKEAADKARRRVQQKKRQTQCRKMVKKKGQRLNKKYCLTNDRRQMCGNVDV